MISAFFLSAFSKIIGQNTGTSITMHSRRKLWQTHPLLHRLENLMPPLQLLQSVYVEVTRIHCKWWLTVEVLCLRSFVPAALRMGSTWWGVHRIGEVKISAAGNRENYKGGFPPPAPSKLFKSFQTLYETSPHLSHCCVVRFIHFLRLAKLNSVMVEIITRIQQSFHWLLYTLYVFLS